MNKFFTFLLVCILFPSFLSAQLIGTKQVPTTNYPTIQAVADSLNLHGVGFGGVTFLVAGDEVFNENPIIFLGNGSEASPVTIAWNGVGTKPVLNFAGSTGALDAGITLKGCDYFTLDGLNITNTASNLEYGLWITNLSESDGAHHNTIKNMHILLDKLNAYQTEGVHVATSAIATVPEGNNHYNKFYNNVIENVMLGYSFDGSNSTTALMGVGNEIGTIDGGESLITDIVMAGVLVDDQNGFSLSNTTIQNLTRIGSGTTAPAAVSTISGNPTEPLTNDFYIVNNTIINLTSSFTSVYGLYMSARKATYYINNNKIHNVTATGGGTNTADGIIIFGTDIIANVFNNMISAIAAPSSVLTGNAASRGINVRSYIQANIFYNTVFMELTAINPGHSSAAFIIYNNSDPVVIRNNIFINKTTYPVGATGFGAAFYKRTPALTNIDVSSDNNIYYAGTPSTNNVIFYGYNSSAPAIDATIEAYKTRTQSFDQNSYSEDVQFAATDDLHIPPLNTTIARGNAQPITTPIAITNDFDGMNRDVLTPDIGADELPNAFPSSAVEPQPINEATAVAVGLTSLQWRYVSSPEYLDPVTFKVYLNTSPDFTGIEPLGLVTFQQGVENYTFNLSGGAPLSYETAYYWKVVPTLDVSIGPDAPEVSVWQFITEMFVFPFPNTAANPLPTGNELVSIELLNLQWEFVKLNNYSSPAGFKVYLGLNAVPGASDLIAWVPFTENITNYSASLSAINLDYNTTYYWKIVPTVDQNSGPDAEGVLVWSFTTSGYPYPNVATNPDPANGGIYEISDVIQVVLNWDYTPNPDYALPVSFKVFIGTDTTATAFMTPVAIIPFIQGTSNYTYYVENLWLFNLLEDGAINYWKIVPTVNSTLGPDALDAIAWSFIVDLLIDVPEIDFSQLSVFPNPGNGVFAVSIGSHGNAQYSVRDISGKVINSGEIIDGKAALDLTGIENGTYILEVINEKKSISKKIIIDSKR